MASRRCWVAVFLLAVAAVGGLVPPALSQERSPQPAKVRLVVLVVFDQLRGDYLVRWEKQFGRDGFRRLMADGAWFQNGHYPYAATLTGAGHASLLTGCPPAKHGIVGNEWYDRSASKEVSCVASARYQPVPPPVVRPGKRKQPGAACPDALRSPTLADALKEATGGKARVVSVSFKARSAVLPAGRKPDACYWLDYDTGRFVTSTYYRDRPHPWVEKFNRGRPADHWFGKQWTRLRSEVDYARLAGPDNVPGEGTGIKQGRTFPHPLTGGLKEPGPNYYKALYNSPFGNDLLLGLVKEAVDAEKLGRGDVPDLLCVSFTSNDPVGHCWGPDSQEVLDVTLRSDLIVRQLLAHLDARVGRGRYLLALTADHGVCPIPEVIRSQGKDAGRVSVEGLRKGAEEFLTRTFDKEGEKGPRWIEALSNSWVYLNPRAVRGRKLEPARVEEALAGWLRKQPGLLAAYGRTRLAAGLPKDDPLALSVRLSFYPDRCGDVAVVLKPFYLFSSEFKTGTTHGSPHSYDTHVPLLVYGPGVRAGIRKEQVSPLAVAAIFARALGIKPPADAQVPVPEGLFGSR